MYTWIGVECTYVLTCGTATTLFAHLGYTQVTLRVMKGQPEDHFSTLVVQPGVTDFAS
jgi:hypothetical protein